MVTLVDELELNRGNVSLFVLLDLLAAFNTIDHGILLGHLSGMGIGGIVPQLFQSLPDGQAQKVVLG